MHNYEEMNEELNEILSINGIARLVFQKRCQEGNIQKLNKIWELLQNKIDIQYEFNFGFMTSCKNGNLEMAKWLWSVYIK